MAMNITQLENVEPFPSQSPSRTVSDELDRLIDLVRSICPADAKISFHYDSRLHLHIDIRRLEDVSAIETMLPTLGAGLFHDIQRGPTPHQPFFHRVSAFVDR